MKYSLASDPTCCASRLFACGRLSFVPTHTYPWVLCERRFLLQIAAVANQERQHSKFNGHPNTSQHGNWQNFRNAEYNREVSLMVDLFARKKSRPLPATAFDREGVTSLLKDIYQINDGIEPH